MILDLFSRGTGHPLADAKELQRVLDELPVEQPLKAIDDIAGWFESLAEAKDFRADRLFEVVGRLDTAAQPLLRNLTDDYLAAIRVGRSDERQIWAKARYFWEQLAASYERVIDASQVRDKVGDSLKSVLPVVVCRYIGACIASIKWAWFRHEVPDKAVWGRIGRAYLIADEGGFAGRSVVLYAHGSSSVDAEILRAVALSTASLESLQPAEIELAERLAGHFLPHFSLSGRDIPDKLFWIDAALAEPPRRLARLPRVTPSLRVVSSGKAADEIKAMAFGVERGSLPAEPDLQGQYAPRVVLKVLRHLGSYWSTQPPMRQSKRLPVKTRLSVVTGLEAAMQALKGEAADDCAEWWSDNVSQGGFGAIIEKSDRTAAVGTLVCVQAEGAANWFVGLVRRYARESDGSAGVGIQTLARHAQAVEFVPSAFGRPSVSAAQSSLMGFRGIALIDREVGEELHVVLPTKRFDLRENLELQLGGRQLVLTPIETIEAHPSYDYARYRVRDAAPERRP